MVAESADGWNTFFGPLDTYTHKLDVLAGHCGDVRRDPRDIRKSLVLGAVVGGTEAEQCAEHLLDYVRLGAGDFILHAWPPPNVGQMELFAQKVARSSEAQRPVSWRRSDRREDRSSC